MRPEWAVPAPRSSTSGARPTRTTSRALRRWWPTTCCCRSSRSRSSRCGSPGACCARPSCRTRCCSTSSSCSPGGREHARAPRSSASRRRRRPPAILAIVAAVWFASSFWGALDTAFCQIYHRDCRTWVRQKLFALGMSRVVLLFIVATVAVPAIAEPAPDERHTTCRSGCPTSAAWSTASRSRPA